MASQKTGCLLSGTLLVSDPVELSVARETVQEAASPTSQLVKALKGAGLQNSDGRPLSPFPRAPKALQGGQKKAIPLTLSVWESKCQAPPQLSRPVLHSMDSSVSTIARWDPDAQPKGTPKSETQASATGSYPSPCRHSRAFL